MSVDTVNEALTRIHLSTIKYADQWSVETFHTRTGMMTVMRECLMKGDIDYFIKYTQMRLASHPDAMSGLLEDLFAEVCGDERAVWEDFEAKLREE